MKDPKESPGKSEIGAVRETEDIQLFRNTWDYP